MSPQSAFCHPGGKLLCQSTSPSGLLANGVHRGARVRVRASHSCIRLTLSGGMETTSLRRDASRQKAESGFSRREADAWTEEDLAVLPAELRPRAGETLDLILRKRVFLVGGACVRSRAAWGRRTSVELGYHDERSLRLLRTTFMMAYQSARRASAGS